MRIIVKNFRCHIDGDFELPDQGLIALSGVSGSGKSSLLKAICYGFYGKIPGKIKKPFSHGKTTCSVEIEYADLKVIRHARPRRLLVTYEGVEYEDDAAQDIIHQTLGMNYEEFLATSYVVQRGNASVLSLSSTEQVKFVETLANSAAERYKEEVKEEIKKVKQGEVKIQAEIEILEAQKQEKELLYPEVPEVPKEIKSGIQPDQVRKKIEDLDASLTRHRESLDATRAKLEKVRSEEKKRSGTESKIASLRKEIEVLERSSAVDIPEEGEKVLETMKDEIEQYKNTIDYYRRYISYAKERDALEHSIEEHRNAVEKKAAELLPEVVDDVAIQIMEEELETVEQQSKEYYGAKALYEAETKKKEQARKDLGEKFKSIRSLSLSGAAGIKTPSKMLECLESNLEERKKELHALKMKGRRKMCCPQCSVILALSETGDDLETVDDSEANNDTDDLEDLIVAAESSIVVLEKYRAEVSRLGDALNTKIPPLGEQPPDPSKLQKTLLRTKRIKEEYENLDPDKLPPAIERMKNSVEKISEEFRAEKFSKTEATACLLELEEEMRLKTTEKDLLEQKYSNLETLKNEVAMKKAQLTKLTSSLSKLTGPSSRELEEDIGKISMKIFEVSSDIQSHRKILDNVSDYEHYQATMMELSSICERLAESQEKYQMLERKLEGLYGLEEAEKEAEVLALEETVASINEHAKLYLDQMFSDPIMVRLECVKDKGKNGLKLQLNTAIDYKGETYDDIEELSGGERQRCDMAFLLAVNDMLGSNILILDECLNELDSSTNTEILSLIRDICGGSKMILVISHEAVRGVFDIEISIAH